MWKSSFFYIDYAQRKEGSSRVPGLVEWHVNIQQNNTGKSQEMSHCGSLNVLIFVIWINYRILKGFFTSPYVKAVLYVWRYREPLFNRSQRDMLVSYDLGLVFVVLILFLSVIQLFQVSVFLKVIVPFISCINSVCGWKMEHFKQLYKTTSSCFIKIQKNKHTSVRREVNQLHFNRKHHWVYNPVISTANAKLKMTFKTWNTIDSLNQFTSARWCVIMRVVGWLGMEHMESLTFLVHIDWSVSSR